MASQLDIDQGGTARQWAQVYLGPSVGWVRVPAKNILGVVAAGTYTLDLSTNFVRVNVAGLVTINLPTAVLPAIPAGVIPVPFALPTITILDIGGHAAAFPITIVPFGTETIMGLASIQITSNFGAFVLNPSSAQRGWTNQ